MASLSPDQIRSLVEEKFSRSFSGNFMSLAALHELVAPIIDMQGVDSFTTRLPWEIEVQGGEIIEGLSENLKFAAKDISSQLQRMLAAGIPPEAMIALSVSEKRLREGIPTFLPAGIAHA